MGTLLVLWHINMSGAIVLILLGVYQYVCTVKNLEKEKKCSILAVYNTGSTLTSLGQKTMGGSIMEVSGEN